MKNFKIMTTDDMIPHIQKVLDGEYAHSWFKLQGKVVILDIGGNVGSYTYWALNNYDVEHIHCYEPNPKNFSDLAQNLINCDAPIDRYTLYNAAVYPTDDKTLKLYTGMNDGMHSILPYMADPKGNSATFDAPVIRPEALPQAHVLKLDTEGCEVQIVTAYLKSHSKPNVIAYEYHNISDRLALEQLMYQHGFVLFAGSVFCHTLGTMVFCRQDGA